MRFNGLNFHRISCTYLYPHQKSNELVPIHKWLFSPISLLDGNFNPRNIAHMPAVKISVRLEIDENISFMDGHELTRSLIITTSVDQGDEPHFLYQQ